jgi:anti-sigma-K factor RskA
MSEIVNDPADADVLAGEYVLGTLDGDERSRAKSLLAADEEFAAKVKVWERRLGELHLMVEPVEPDAAIWDRIKAKLPETRPDIRVPEPQPPEQPPEAPTAEDAPARLEAVLAAISDVAPAPEAAPAFAAGAAPEPTADVLPPVAPVRAPGATQAAVVGHNDHLIRRRLSRWRSLALVMTALVVAMAALIAAWRFAPDRVPPRLQPVELMRLVGVGLAPAPTSAPRRIPAQFDE